MINNATSYRITLEDLEGWGACYLEEYRDELRRMMEESMHYPSEEWKEICRMRNKIVRDFEGGRLIHEALRDESYDACDRDWLRCHFERWAIRATETRDELGLRPRFLFKKVKEHTYRVLHGDRNGNPAYYSNIHMNAFAIFAYGEFRKLEDRENAKNG